MRTLFTTRIKRLLKLIIQINIPRTIYLNFKLFPFLTAIRFPIFAYGKIINHYLRGKFVINYPIRTGMIKIGYRWVDLAPCSYQPTQLYLLGNIYFNGPCIIGGGTGVFIQKSNASIVMGLNTIICSGVMVKSLDTIEIGDFSTIAFGSVIMNSNMHFVKDINTGQIRRIDGKIIIGKNCWINPMSIITKGTILPDYSITARNTYLNKDYTEYGSNLFLVGSPAKPLKSKIQRIFDINKEKQLRAYFEQNTSDYFQDEVGTDYSDKVDDETIIRGF